MASASARLLLSWQRSIPGPSDSVHGQLSLRCLHPPIAVSEQQRTSCSSAGSAHRGLSGQMPARPHSSLAGPDRGEGDCDGGDGGGESDVDEDEVAEAERLLEELMAAGQVSGREEEEEAVDEDYPGATG
mmetsp:Transcript_23673/g.69982  ORF Transcript_23673/g.69982 Transcript_23673/m.69982 type:complete len:130 (-) Transcript_23673:249-638(-)